jgi:mono/diheme cytochrome c family protein
MKFRIMLPLLAVSAAVFAAETNHVNPANPVAEAQIQHGKYLVENIGMCAECHTPKTDKGEYDRSQWLQGNLLDFKPTVLMPFAAVAPPIAGLPGFTEEQALKFLETGIDVTGKPAMPPMPQYRFNSDDARAVLAYLRSLKR